MRKDFRSLALVIPFCLSLYYYYQASKFNLLKSERILLGWNLITGVILLLITSIYSFIRGIEPNAFNINKISFKNISTRLFRLDACTTSFINIPLLTIILSFWALYGMYLVLANVVTIEKGEIRIFTANSAVAQLVSVINCIIFVYYITKIPNREQHKIN